MRTDLSLLKPGESGVVKKIISGNLSARLVEMGLYKGKKVRMLYKAPFGDPVAVDVEGYVLSLRLDEARNVCLEPATC